MISSTRFLFQMFVVLIVGIAASTTTSSLLMVEGLPSSSHQGRLSQQLPPPPKFQSIPLPVKLAGGLFLFRSSVKDRKDKELSKQLLRQVETVINQDPIVLMEFGPNLECGGIYSSSSSVDKSTGIHQLIMEFQITGGNAWAQGICHGYDTATRTTMSQQQQQQQPTILSLGISNMDAALNGGWIDIPIPSSSSSSFSSSQTQELEMEDESKSMEEK